MGKRCGKGKPCGATCIERQDECLKDAGNPISRALKSATYKIAKSASPVALEKAGLSKYAAQSVRQVQLQAKRILNQLRKEGDTVIKTDGIMKERTINWGAILGSDTRPVGSGEFGSFATLHISKVIKLTPKAAEKVADDIRLRLGVKVGKIGPNEVEAIKRVGEAGLGPKLVGARVSPIVGTRHRIPASNGAIAMTVVPGTSYNSSPNNVKGSDKSEIYWEAMGKLHKLGIAHNDLHGGNILIDSGSGYPRGRIVDFGLAQLSPKAALAEALGSISGANYQFAANRNSGHALTFKGNLLYVEQLLMDKGLSGREIREIIKGAIRKKDNFFNKGVWGKISDKEAEHFIENLYEGIVVD